MAWVRGWPWFRRYNRQTASGGDLAWARLRNPGADLYSRNAVQCHRDPSGDLARAAESRDVLEKIGAARGRKIECATSQWFFPPRGLIVRGLSRDQFRSEKQRPERLVERCRLAKTRASRETEMAPADVFFKRANACGACREGLAEREVM